MPYEPRVLTPEQIEHFLAHGYVTLHECFTREQAAEWTKDLWVRLGMDPHDARTWTVERVHMPVRRKFDVGEFAPKAWNAILDLVGGPDRIDPAASSWTDGFIVNLGPPPGTSSTFSSTNSTPNNSEKGQDLKSRALSLTNWHVDGDFFTHFLDSREQALLVIPLLSDIAPHGGATFIAPDSLPLISHYLYNHPEGVVPRDKTWTPAPWGLGEPDKSRGDPREAKRRREERGESVEGFWDHVQEVKRCERFVELTGTVGDVVLLHPFMLHSASPNTLRVPRVITNPPVGLKSPFVFRRDDVNEYSIVERATLRALGRKEEEGLVWEVKGERREVVPERVRVQREMAERERGRLEEVERMRERERAVVEGRAEAVAVA